MEPKVTLVNFTPLPMETVWILWEASKTDGPVELSPARVRDTVPKEKLEKLFWDVIRQQIPVGEHIQFIFMLDNVSVSFREQMVRHRIGVHVGDRIGVDIVPDLADSTWWSQSMRIQDMGTFAARDMYRVPETLQGKTVPHMGENLGAEELYRATMIMIQETYKKMVAAGVPMEDARELIPLGAQHRISWALNLQSLLHILGKRGCWILQLGLWGPIIMGMVEELAAKVNPMFRRIVAPPCIDADGQFSSCQYRLENERRLTGDDRHSLCPLYLCRDDYGVHSLTVCQEQMDSIPIASAAQMKAQPQLAERVARRLTVLPRHEEMVQRAEDYRRLWGHNPYTWAPEET